MPSESAGRKALRDHGRAFAWESEYAAAFPLAWYADFLDEIVRRGIRVVTYRDLFAGVDDYDHEQRFPLEKAAWDSRTQDSHPPTLVIQHDVDYVPEFTHRMIEMEMACGIRSNVLVFNELHATESQEAKRPYGLDFDLLRRAEAAGFVIGYHNNVLQRGVRTLAEAEVKFEADVVALRKQVSIEYFCPHGGRAVEIDGKSMHNYDVPIPQSLRGTIRWVYNRFGVKFNSTWSDGGIRKRVGDAVDSLDLVGTYVPSMSPGRRYFVLVHPQRWGHQVEAKLNPTLAERPWFKRVIAAHSQVAS
ncbi:MAG: hypothetical protein O3C10_07465 [Chloroflexi bacterium]|nr:hypothetical protein [Chloroflexota bacterium]